MPARRYHHSGRAHRVPPGRRRSTSADRAATAAPPTNYHGIHLLRSGPVIESVVASADLGPDSLVLDLGAGPGTLTAPLAATGARILAIEREPRFVARLHERFAHASNVRIVEADLRSVPLPRRPFSVVSSIPYSLSTTLLRRLVGPVGSPLQAADLVVEWGFAKRVTQDRARDLESAWWGACYELRVVRRIGAAAFRPRPAVDSAHLAVRVRPGLARRRTRHGLYVLVAAAYQDPGRPLRSVLAEVVPRNRAAGLASAAGLSPSVAAHEVPVARWAELAISASDALLPRLPALPRHLAHDRPGRRR